MKPSIEEAYQANKELIGQVVFSYCFHRGQLPWEEEFLSIGNIAFCQAYHTAANDVTAERLADLIRSRVHGACLSESRRALRKIRDDRETRHFGNAEELNIISKQDAPEGLVDAVDSLQSHPDAARLAKIALECDANMKTGKMSIQRLRRLCVKEGDWTNKRFNNAVQHIEEALA